MQLEVLIYLFVHGPEHAGSEAFVIPGTGAEVVTQKSLFCQPSPACSFPAQTSHPRMCEALLMAGISTVRGTKPTVLLSARVSVGEGPQ